MLVVPSKQWISKFHGNLANINYLSTIPKKYLDNSKLKTIAAKKLEPSLKVMNTSQHPRKCFLTEYSP